MLRRLRQDPHRPQILPRPALPKMPGLGPRAVARRPTGRVVHISTSCSPLPAPIAVIALQNKTVVYDILFKAAAETVRTIAADPKHLGAKIGMTAVLHTWGAVPGAARVRVRRRRVNFFGDLTPLAESAAFTAYLRPLRQIDWVVYAKRPFGGPQHLTPTNSSDASCWTSCQRVPPDPPLQFRGQHSSHHQARHHPLCSTCRHLTSTCGRATTARATPCSPVGSSTSARAAVAPWSRLQSLLQPAPRTGAADGEQVHQQVLALVPRSADDDDPMIIAPPGNAPTPDKGQVGTTASVRQSGTHQRSDRVRRASAQSRKSGARLPITIGSRARGNRRLARPECPPCASIRPCPVHHRPKRRQACQSGAETGSKAHKRATRGRLSAELRLPKSALGPIARRQRRTTDIHAGGQ
jgi:hypothetical protein